MNKVWTQSEIYTYLLGNPLQAKVHTGSLEDMNNEDYIFFDLLSETPLGYDNTGSYLATLTFTVATKDFDNRKALVKYIKDRFTCRIDYDTIDESEYYAAMCTTTLLMKDEQEI